MTVKRELHEIFNKYRIAKALPTNPERSIFIDRVDHAINELPEKEKQIISLRFLQRDSDEVKDYDIYGVLGLSESVFYRHKNNAYKKLAALLELSNDWLILQPITLNPLDKLGQPRQAYLIEEDRAIVQDGLVSLVRVVPDLKQGEYKPANSYNFQTITTVESELDESELRELLHKFKTISAYDLLTRHYDWHNEHYDINKQMQGR